MKIDFSLLQEVTIPNMSGGNGEVIAQMLADADTKIMKATLPVGASIGTHEHAASCEFNYVLSGFALVTCDGEEERLSVGECQYCPKGSSHSIANAGNEERRHEIVRYIAALKTDESVERNVHKAIGFLLGKGRFIGRDKS